MLVIYMTEISDSLSPVDSALSFPNFPAFPKMQTFALKPSHACAGLIHIS